MVRSISALLLATMVFSDCQAEDWARTMFKTTSHDFGSVARAAKAEYAFVLTNPYAEAVHISSVRSNCGCTTPRIEKDTLQTYEQGAIVAHVNSDRFLGQNGATLTVTFDKPRFAEAQLDVRVFIHDKVVFEPNSVFFGTIEQGTTAERRIAVTCTGRNDWRVTNVKSESPYLSGVAVETSRSDKSVVYHVTARIDSSAPPGALSDHLFLVTNDTEAASVPLLVEGLVSPPISVSPSSLFFGVTSIGQSLTKSVVLRSKQPFRVTGITASCPCLQAKLPSESQPKAIHLIPITFTAGKAPGKVSQTIRVQTDLDAAGLTFPAYAAVMSP